MEDFWARFLQGSHSCSLYLSILGISSYHFLVDPSLFLVSVTLVSNRPRLDLAVHNQVKGTDV